MAEDKQVPQQLVHEILCAIQGALGEENQRVFAKAGRKLGAKWASTLERAASVDDLMQKVAAYLRDDLQLGGNISLEREGADYVIRIRGCCVCHAEMVKQQHDIRPACAVSMLPVGALTTNLEIRNVRLKEIRKPGPAGDCDMVYEVRQ
jgi:hypothetical protein